MTGLRQYVKWYHAKKSPFWDLRRDIKWNHTKNKWIV